MNEYYEKTGGPAFPRPATISPEGVYVSEGFAGMSQRQFGAWLAMLALLSSSKQYSIEGKQGPFEVTDLVRGSYILADAMIEEGKKPIV